MRQCLCARGAALLSRGAVHYCFLRDAWGPFSPWAVRLEENRRAERLNRAKRTTFGPADSSCRSASNCCCGVVCRAPHICMCIFVYVLYFFVFVVSFLSAHRLSLRSPVASDRRVVEWKIFVSFLVCYVKNQRVLRRHTENAVSPKRDDAGFPIWRVPCLSDAEDSSEVVCRQDGTRTVSVLITNRLLGKRGKLGVNAWKTKATKNKRQTKQTWKRTKIKQDRKVNVNDAHKLNVLCLAHCRARVMPSPFFCQPERAERKIEKNPFGIIAADRNFSHKAATDSWFF